MSSDEPKMSLLRPPQSLLEEAEINAASLQVEFAKLPSRYLYWQWNLAAASSKVAEARMRRDDMRSHIVARVSAAIEKDVEDGIKPRGKGQGPGGLTSDQFASRVEQEMAPTGVERELRRAEQNEARMKAMCETMRAKKDMLQMMGAHDRAARNVNGGGS